jgi:hypothetical protein
MASAKPPPFTIAEERHAAMRLVIELHQAIHDPIFYPNPAPAAINTDVRK